MVRKGLPPLFPREAKMKQIERKGRGDPMSVKSLHIGPWEEGQRRSGEEEASSEAAPQRLTCACSVGNAASFTLTHSTTVGPAAQGSTPVLPQKIQARRTGCPEGGGAQRALREGALGEAGAGEQGPARALHGSGCPGRPCVGSEPPAPHTHVGGASQPRGSSCCRLAGILGFPTCDKHKMVTDDKHYAAN